MDACLWTLAHGESRIVQDVVFNGQRHAGDEFFIKHLWVSGNVDWLRFKDVVLFRPQDLAYAQNWVQLVHCLPEDNRPRLLFMLRRMEKDRRLWFRIKDTERPK